MVLSRILLTSFGETSWPLELRNMGISFYVLYQFHETKTFSLVDVFPLRDLTHAP